MASPRQRGRPGRNRAILANALEYAVERRLLSSNPVKAIKWKAPKTTHEVDRRCVVNPAQARRLLDAVREQATQRPAAGRILRGHLLRGPPAGGSRQPPQGQHHPPAARMERRHGRMGGTRRQLGRAAVLLGRARGRRRMDRRRHPPRTTAPQVPPRRGMAPGTHPPAADPAAPRAPGKVRHRPRRSRLLRRPRRRAGVDHLPSRVGQGTPCRADSRRNTHPRWPSASTTSGTLASRPGSTAGVPPAQVAEWAGHSVAVLLKVYAKCIDGQDQIAKRRIEDALRDPGEPEETRHTSPRGTAEPWARIGRSERLPQPLLLVLVKGTAVE